MESITLLKAYEFSSPLLKKNSNSSEKLIFMLFFLVSCRVCDPIGAVSKVC